MYDNIDETLEKIYIIQPITRENSSKYKILQAEAVALIESAGAVYAGTIYQNIREINAATFIGEGKLQEFPLMTRLRFPQRTVSISRTCLER